MVSVSEQVRREALRVGAQEWLDALPGLVAGLERDWGVTVGAPYDGGTEAFVAAARTAAGAPVVLKVLVPGRESAAAHEMTTLELAGGDGCVRLLRGDADRGALLLERLGRSLADLALPMARRHEILTATAERVWRPVRDTGLPTGADKGRWLVEYVRQAWEEQGRPCSEQAVAHAIGCAERRVAAHDEARAVLVHGDVHQWNTLEDGAGGYKLVDPDGLVADAEYDLGIIMREDPEELLRHDPRERAEQLARRTGLDPVAVWEWGAIERVSTGLLCAAVGLQPVGGQMLAAAEWCAGF